MWRTRIWIASFRQSFWWTICAETWWTAVWELLSVRFNSSRLEALVVVATCGCGSSLVVAVLRSPFSCVTCSHLPQLITSVCFCSVAFVWVKRLLTLGQLFFEVQFNIVDLGRSVRIWSSSFQNSRGGEKRLREEVSVKDFLGDLKIPECLKISWTTTWTWCLAGSLLSWSKLWALVSRGSKKKKDQRCWSV